MATSPNMSRRVAFSSCSQDWDGEDDDDGSLLIFDVDFDAFVFFPVAVAVDDASADSFEEFSCIIPFAVVVERGGELLGKSCCCEYDS